MSSHWIELFPSLILTLLFFVYGFNHYYLMMAARTYKSPVLPSGNHFRPAVCIHLPIYNESYVVERLVNACVDMAECYGVDKVRILILDDSDDDTAHVVDQVVHAYRERQPRIEVLHRDRRDGFKAGALQAALLETHEDFIAIFDADFLPPPDFLNRTIPYFDEDPHLGMIQCRWAHLNRDYNFLTRAIALGIDVHFLIEQTGRYSAGHLQNFNGSGGVLRTSSVLEAGGWETDTLAEDLDVSYRIQIGGYGLLFLRDLQSPGEIPLTVPSFKRQQGRWACGSLRTARKLLPDLIRDQRLTWQTRLQAVIHLTAYLLHPLMLCAFLLICGLTLGGLNFGTLPHFTNSFKGALTWSLLVSTAVLFIQFMAWSVCIALIALCAVAPWISAAWALKEQHLSVWRNLVSLMVLFLLGYGVSLSNSIEAGKALLTNRDWAFSRTPKYAVALDRVDWKTSKYQVPLNFVWIMELALVVLGVIAIAIAMERANFGILLFLAPYTAAYAFVASLTILQSRNEKRA